MTFTMELVFPWQISQTIGRADFFGQQKLLSLSQGLETAIIHKSRICGGK